MESPPAIRILTTCEEALVREAARGFHPAAHVVVVGRDAIRRLEPAECLVVSVGEDARTARANGFDGSIVILTDPRNADEVPAFRAQGSWFASPANGDHALLAAFRDAITIGEDGTPVATDADTIRTRRLVAAGELVIALRHAINNPLAALMAEVQLLQMEAREPETRASATRMLELVRRLTELTRTLESGRDR
jgi:signal transduction histidine kinase